MLLLTMSLSFSRAKLALPDNLWFLKPEGASTGGASSKFSLEKLAMSRGFKPSKDERNVGE